MGAGYIGTALLQQWVDPSVEFTATTTTEEKVSSLDSMAKHVVVMEGTDRDAVAKLVDGSDVLVVCVAPSTSDNYREVYLDTANSIAASLDGRERPFYLLYTSSTSVYGDQNGASVDEATERCPISESARILCEVEDIILGCSSSAVTSCVLRLGGIYGPGRGLQARARRMSERQLTGTGELPTNHSHRDDIVAGIRFCIDKRCQGVVNLVNDDHTSRKELYANLCRGLNVPEPVWNESQPLTHGSNCKVSNAKIKELGFHFLHPMALVKTEEHIL